MDGDKSDKCWRCGHFVYVKETRDEPADAMCKKDLEPETCGYCEEGTDNVDFLIKAEKEERMSRQ